MASVMFMVTGFAVIVCVMFPAPSAIPATGTAIAAIFRENVAQYAACGGTAQGEPGVTLRNHGTRGSAETRAGYRVGGFPVVMRGAACKTQSRDADDGKFSEAVRKTHGVLLLLNHAPSLDMGHLARKRANGVLQRIEIIAVDGACFVTVLH